MKPLICRVALLCITVLSVVLSLASCRNRNFSPVAPPVDGASGDALPADFQCWVKTAEGAEYALNPEAAAAVFDEVRLLYERSDSIDAFSDGEGVLRLVFCTGGTAPETTIPAYQLPNATLYGVYTLFPDDRGRYGGDVITAHVHSFQLKEGSYERIAGMVGDGR